FIPIATMSFSTLKGQEVGQGAAFTGMMRQLGGSFGIAIITTFMSRRNALHRTDLIVNYNPENPTFMQRLNGLEAKFMSAGMPPNQAKSAALSMLDHLATGQAQVLTYMDVFLYIG